QFAKKNVLIGIDRMDDQVQQPRDVCVERAAFLAALINDTHGGQFPLTASDNGGGAARSRRRGLRRCRASNRCSAFDELVERRRFSRANRHRTVRLAEALYHLRSGACTSL